MAGQSFEDFKGLEITESQVPMINGIILMHELPKIRGLLRGILTMLSAAVGMQIGKMIAPLMEMLF